jgi:hypothetical protein
VAAAVAVAWARRRFVTGVAMSVLVAVPSSRRHADTYDAFISYGHANDEMVARSLQRAMHNFARPWYRLRALRVFLDDASLPATPGLRRNLQAALDQSSFLVLLASPGAANSAWVAWEVDYWRRNKDMDRLLIALTGGEIVWAGHDFDWMRTTALPEALHGAFREEPRFTDLRRCLEDPDQISLRDARFRLCVADLVAPLHGRPKDALVGEDVRVHRRVVRLVRGTIASLIAVVVTLALLVNVAIVQRSRAIEERDAAQRAQRELVREKIVAENALLDATNQRDKANAAADEAQRQQKLAEAAKAMADKESDAADGARRLAAVQRDAALSARNLTQARLLAAQALALPDEDLDTALLLAVRAFRILDISATRDALTTVMHRSDRISGIVRAEGTIGAADFNAARKLLAIVDYGKGVQSAQIRAWDVARRVNLWSTHVDEVPVKLAVVERTGEIAAFGKRGISFFDGATGAPEGKLDSSRSSLPCRQLPRPMGGCSHTWVGTSRDPSWSCGISPLDARSWNSASSRSLLVCSRSR